MHDRAAIWFLLLLLALLAALTLWVEHTVQPPPPKRDGSTRHDPDYKLTNFNISKTDKQGNLRHVLSAAQMLHYPDDDSTYLTGPYFKQVAQGKPDTSIKGDRGQVSRDGKDVYFMGNVKVVRDATRSKGQLTVLTDYLHIIPEQDIAKTNRPVSILQEPHTIVHGTGMIYNKREGTLQLLKRVSVHYEKPASKPKPLDARPPLKAKPSASSRQKVKPTKARTPAVKP